MEIWELNQLSRSEIEKMRDEVKSGSAALDNARQKLASATKNSDSSAQSCCDLREDNIVCDRFDIT